MSAYTDGLNEVAHGAFCDIAARGVVGGLLFAGLTAETVAGALGGLAVTAVSAHLYASYCGRPMPPEERPRRPFTGGQCDNVRYYVSVGAFATHHFNQQRYQVGGGGLVWGKIHRAELVVDPATFNTATVIVDGSRDDDIFNIASEGSTYDGIHPTYTYSDFYCTITRPDGLPDNCGDPPERPPVFPPGGNVINNNFTYIDRSGNTITLPVTLNFGLPRIDVNGTFNMPVTINFNNDPTLNIGGDVNFNTGDFTINVGGGHPPSGVGVGDPDNVVRPPGAGDPLPTPPGVPIDPPSGVPGEPGAPAADPPTIPTDPPTPPPKKKTYKVVRGVIVSVSPADSSATIIFQEDIPDIYAPSLGYVSFLCKVGNSYAWTVDIPVKNRKQIIECPWSFGAVDVKADAKSGAVFSLDKIYDEIPVASFPV